MSPSAKFKSFHDEGGDGPAPASYQRRYWIASAPSPSGSWKTVSWEPLEPKTLAEARAFITEWNAFAFNHSLRAEYRLDPKLLEGKVKNTTQQFNSPLKKPILVKREEGEVWEIPASSSPLWTKQWGYQGSAKEPYIVSRKKKIDGGTTHDGWACSCRGFTQHTPRKECKHVINIKHQYGLGTVNPTKHAVANLDSEEAAAFAEFKRQKAQNAEQKPVSGDADLTLFGQTGRKFR